MFSCHFVILSNVIKHSHLLSCYFSPLSANKRKTGEKQLILNQRQEGYLHLCSSALASALLSPRLDTGRVGSSSSTPVPPNRTIRRHASVSWRQDLCVGYVCSVDAISSMFFIWSISRSPHI